MTITFYNIPGISSANEPLFTSVANRTSTLSSYIVKSWSTAYYPVQYENRIKCDTVILPLATVFNYIKIEMYSQEWFYFIDSFTYVNEKVYFINLSLDAIQTFYFVTNIRRFEETRKLTFSGLRDNLSVDPTLYVHSITDFDANDYGVFVFQFKDLSETVTLEYPYDSQTNPPQVADIDPTQYDNNNGAYYTDGLKTFILLIPRDSSGLSIRYWDYMNDRYADYNVTITLWLRFYNKLINEPNIVNAYYTHIMPAGILPYNNNTGYLILPTIGSLYKYGLFKIGGTYSERSIITASPINYGRFTTPVRAVCDSNYTQITIGEVNDNVIVPIELLEPETQYDLYCRIDYSSGTRTYWVDAQPLLDIKFKQVCNSVESVAVFNDMYNIYLSQNKGTLTTGLALQKTQTWVNFGNQILNQNAAKAFSGAMQGGVAGGIVSGMEATVTSGVDLFNSLYGIDKSIQAQRENAYYTPDTIKLGNNSTSDVANGFLHRVVIETRVADYEDIIQARSYIGYLAHDIKSFNSLSGLITSYTPVDNKRLIMGTAEVSLTAFNTRDNIVAIKDRLEKGVRFYTNISALGT